MKINLQELRDSPGQRLHFPCHESIESQNLITPVTGDIFLSAHATAVKLKVNIQTTARLSCHRCLNPFLQPIELDLEEEFVYEDYLNVGAFKSKERELQKEDFFETVPYDGTIDISDFVYQAIVLAIPNYCTCGPNCAGPTIYKRSSSTGKQGEAVDDSEKEAWVDPRWHNLKRIFSNDTNIKKVRDNK